MTAGVKGITIWQPWASLLAAGVKRAETRSWRTNYRGPLVIHAGTRRAAVPERVREIAQDAGLPVESLTRGAIVGVGWLNASIEINATTEVLMSHPEYVTEKLLGDWTRGRFFWSFLRTALLDEPIPFTGQQGLWSVPESILEVLNEARAWERLIEPRR